MKARVVTVIMLVVMAVAVGCRPAVAPQPESADTAAEESTATLDVVAPDGESLSFDDVKAMTAYEGWATG
jgi:hypothetical protein